MPHLAWGTDVHLDHCTPEVIDRFCQEVKSSEAQALCLTGDISEGPLITAHLKEVSRQIDMPLYFVLGNHDYYQSSIAHIREEMQHLTQKNKNIQWLQNHAPIPLSKSTCLIGHDGWSDAQHGDYTRSTIRLKDYRLIQELADAGDEGRQECLQALGQEAARETAPILHQALEKYSQIFFLTHPPSFREACLYKDEIADDNWAPHFTCKALGDLFLEVLPQYPKAKMTILAGHTHNPCNILVHPQIRIKVGKAEYEAPELQPLLKYV